MQGLQSRKAVGTNGLPIELYKELADIIIRLMLDIFTAPHKECCLPEDQQISITVVIHKKGKPPMDYNPYPYYGYRTCKGPGDQATNQFVFMPHRSIHLNLRRLHGVLHLIEPPDTQQALLMALDAKMVFDSIDSFLGCHPGYRINWSKSAIFPLSGVMPRFPHECTAPVVLEGFQYLKIYVTRDSQEFLHRIIHPQPEKLQDLLA
ncbi:hypothetical protein NDU88_001356 [Pleurodeles waltl]|uniref:Uncharacterized protein n=1 Tax=Pleurodeles waltl TaxID=8319 RepID=A0AAV7THK1_PLEWA|nr:hypothetical protein NDU88_001356 [Pleurodeles waltl]